MTDIEYTIRKICQRRGVGYTSIQSVAMGMRLAFGLANLTPLLPVVANTFYYCHHMAYSVMTAQVTNGISLRITNYGGASAGDIEIGTAMTIGSFGFIDGQWECDSMLYIVNGNTAGVVSLFGTVFKITYA